MTRLYIVRHGENVGNINGIFVGHKDISLTEKGHIQAELTARYLEDKPIDVLYSIDLKRAYETCRHIADIKGMEIHTHIRA